MNSTTGHPGLENIPSGAELIGELEVRQALRADFEEPAKLDLLDAPISIYRTSSDGVDRFDAVIDHEPLTGDQFYEFLKEVSPSKVGFDSRFGTLADWRLIDGPRDVNDERLTRLHTHLGGAWQEFAASQPAFYRTLTYERPPRIKAVTEATLRPVRDHDFATLEQDILETPGIDIGAIVELLQGADTEADIEAYIYGAIAKAVSRGRGPRGKILDSVQTRPFLQEQYDAWGGLRKRKIVRQALLAIGAEAKQAVFRHLRSDKYDYVTMAGEMLMYPRWKMAEGTSLEDALANRRTVEQDGYQAEFMDIIHKDGSVHSVFVKGSHKRIRSYDYTVAPLISWNRDSEGQRSFNVERIETEQHPGVAYDGALGILAVAYFSPDIRNEWPERMGLPGGRYEQLMRPAQVPVLALMRKAQLLKSDFIEAAEDVPSSLART